MNFKAIIFDVAIPGIFVLGTGVATFMLSGGPEEYPSSDDEKEDQEKQEDAPDGDHDGELNIQHNNENLIPKWAIELSEQTQTLSEEVRLLKEAAQANMKLQQEQFHALFLQRNEENKQSSLIEEQDKLQVQKPWTEDDWKTQLRWKVWRLGLAAAETSKETEESFAVLYTVVSQEIERFKTINTEEVTDTKLDPACDMLIMYMNNILKNPNIPRYRRIATTNNMHINGLAKIIGHDALLHAVGFISQPDRKHYIYEWHSLPSVESSSSASKEAPKDGPRKPDSVETARVLLVEAVMLLTALKKSRRALAELILELMDMPPVSSMKENAEKVAAVPPYEEEAPSASSPHMLPAVLSAPTSASVGDESLITVLDIPDDEEIDNGAASVEANLDFMQILQKAQQQAGGACALKPSSS